MKIIVYCPYYMSSHWLRDYSLVLEISATYRLPLTVCCLLADHWLILLAPVGQTVDNAIHWKKSLPSAWRYWFSYYSSTKQGFIRWSDSANPPFEQPGPGCGLNALFPEAMSICVLCDCQVFAFYYFFSSKQYLTKNSCSIHFLHCDIRNNQDRWARLITLTSTLIIPDITKTSAIQQLSKNIVMLL